jgi:integrative and conjugative element protein (TIGR02256 family)
LRYACKEIGLYIDIKNDVVQKIKDASYLHYPNEHGGILVGNYSEDKTIAFVNDMILPTSYQASPVSFERGSSGIKSILSEFFASENPQVYVGEWHTHPNAHPIPSPTDVFALIAIARHPDVSIENPIMLIIGLYQQSIDIAFYVYFNQKVYRYEEI